MDRLTRSASKHDEYLCDHAIIVSTVLQEYLHHFPIIRPIVLAIKQFLLQVPPHGITS